MNLFCVFFFSNRFFFLIFFRCVSFILLLLLLLLVLSAMHLFLNGSEIAELFHLMESIWIVGWILFWFFPFMFYRDTYSFAKPIFFYYISIYIIFFSSSFSCCLINLILYAVIENRTNDTTLYFENVGKPNKTRIQLLSHVT